MTASGLIVLIGGAGIIIFILWFFFGPKEKREAEVLEKTGQSIQAINIVVEGGYSPSEVVVKKGIPVKITFDRRESGECSEWVVFEKLKVKKKLNPFAKTKIEFTPSEVGEFPFVCGMGMLHGKLIVKE